MMGRPLHLFDAFGVELEYMIVDSQSLNVRPICDRLMQSISGTETSDLVRGQIAYSNELALHVVELKTHFPAATLAGLAGLFQEEVRTINDHLESFEACLLPTAMHPWMDPFREMKLWPHENNPIYEAYHRIFDCRGHGWANLQSTHLNFPFANNEEFARLHAAIRLILPLVPTLAASSPLSDGRSSGLADTRLEVYRTNSQRVPEVAGLIVPETVSSQTEYRQIILEPMYRAIAPHDPENLLQEEFLNARGAIARFGRGSIEIRLIDIQECPANDIAIAELLIAVLKLLVAEHWTNLATQQQISTEQLAAILRQTTQHAEQTILSDAEFLRGFGFREVGLTGMEFWKELVPQLELPSETHLFLERLFADGTLSTRIQQAVSAKPTHAKLVKVYRQLADCLQEGETFSPTLNTP